MPLLLLFSSLLFSSLLFSSLLFSSLLPAIYFSFLDHLDCQGTVNREGNFSWCRRSFSRLLWSVQVTALAAALKTQPLFWNMKRHHWVFGCRNDGNQIPSDTARRPRTTNSFTGLLNPQGESTMILRQVRQVLTNRHDVTSQNYTSINTAVRT